MTEKSEGGSYNVLESYVLARGRWKMRKEWGNILDVNGKVLYHLQKGKWLDGEGVVKVELRWVSKFLILNMEHFYVLDPLGQQLGSVLCTRGRSDRSNVPSWRYVGRYSLIDSVGRVIANAEPSDQERVVPAYAISSLDGRVLASIHKAASEDHYQVDILLHGLHPLVLLSYMLFYGGAMNHVEIRK